MKDKVDMKLDTTMDAVMDMIMDAVVEEHTLVVYVYADVASNAEGVNTTPRMGTAPNPAQNMKLPDQSIKL